MASMPEVIDPLALAGEGFRLSKLVVMMWEPQINSSSVDVEVIAEQIAFEDSSGT